MEKPSDPVGYCAVVMPGIDLYQACFIHDTPEIRGAASSMRFAAMMAMGPDQVFGAMQAAFAEGMMTQNEGVIASAALALKQMSGFDYFYVEATRLPGGTHTELFQLEALSCDEARLQVNNLPKVLEIKARLAGQISDLVAAGSAGQN